jgi:endoglucanase
LHHYAANYKQSNRDKAAYAISKGLPLFVTEYGVADSSGNGSINYDEATLWWDFDDEHKLSYVNWAMDDKYEADSALISNTNPSQIGDPSRWTASGKLVNQKYQSTDQGVWNTTKSTSPIPTALPYREFNNLIKNAIF